MLIFLFLFKKYFEILQTKIVQTKVNLNFRKYFNKNN